MDVGGARVGGTGGGGDALCGSEGKRAEAGGVNETKADGTREQRLPLPPLLCGMRVRAENTCSPPFQLLCDTNGLSQGTSRSCGQGRQQQGRITRVRGSSTRLSENAGVQQGRLTLAHV